jgi:hypothetical protein
MQLGGHRYRRMQLQKVRSRQMLGAYDLELKSKSKSYNELDA